MSLSIVNGTLADKQLEPNDSSLYSFLIFADANTPTVLENITVTTTIAPTCYVGIQQKDLTGVSLSDQTVTYKPMPYPAGGGMMQAWIVSVLITTVNAAPAPSLDMINVAVDYEYASPATVTGVNNFLLSAD